MMRLPAPLRAVPLLCLLAFTAATPARADLLWYNGDYDNRDTFDNVNNAKINVGGTVTIEKSLVYDNFVVPVGETWTITSVYSLNQMSFYATPTTATWEIRTGVSLGNPGSIKYSGDTAATYTAQSQVSGYYYFGTPTMVTASVNSMTLTAGTYWLAVAPDSGNFYNEQSYIETTSGANAIGTPRGNDGNSFVNYSGPNGTISFGDTSDNESAPGRYDYAMGLNGIRTSAVPSPPGLVLFGIGLVGVGLRRFRCVAGR